jgi:hypothetical protein
MRWWESWRCESDKEDDDDDDDTDADGANDGENAAPAFVARRYAHTMRHRCRLTVVMAARSPPDGDTQTKGK